MADVGPLPTDLLKKKIHVEILRLEHMAAKQEYEIIEKHEEINRMQKNVDASRREIEVQKAKLAAVDNPAPPEATKTVTNG